MGGRWWIFLIIAVAVWILNALLRSAEDERRKRREPRPPGEDDPRGRSSRSAGDIDRFLEEINRRRRQASERRLPPARPREAAGPGARPQPSRVEAPSRTDSPPWSESPSRKVPPVRSAEEQVRQRERGKRAGEPESPTAAQQLPQTVSPAAATATPAIVDSGLSNSTPTPAPTDREPAPAAVQLLTLLRAPQWLRTAVLLKEVFDKPLSQRGRPAGPVARPGR
jgi:hypothetical protein